MTLGTGKDEQGLARLSSASAVALPLRVLLTGAALLALIEVARRLGIVATLAAMPDPKNLALLAALMVVGAGLTILAFLWWLSARHFRLLGTGPADAATLAALRDLPLGLPEGTVRAILALIVGVVGLSLLVFSGVLNLKPEVAGYVNGIVTGVFGFYFGNRAAGASSAARLAADGQARLADASERVGAAKQSAEAAREDATRARQAGAQAQAALADARTAARVDETGRLVVALRRHLPLAKAALDLARELPPGTLPDAAKSLVEQADTLLEAVAKAAPEAIDEDALARLGAARDALTGEKGPLAALINTAAPILSGLPIPGAAALAGLLAIGSRLGSAEFQRWQARVLAAPLGQGLIVFGTLTPELLRAALADAPILRAALGSIDPPGARDAFLANAILADDAAERLVAHFKDAGLGDLDQARRGIEELRQALLALIGADDITDASIASMRATFENAAGSAFKPAAGLSREMVEAATARAASASRRDDQADPALAALHALILLVGQARGQHPDLAEMLADLT